MSQNALFAFISPVIQFLQKAENMVQPVLQKFSAGSVDISHYLQAFVAWNQCIDSLKEVDWLPLQSIPVHFITECDKNPELLDRRLSDYYHNHWVDIRRELEARMMDYHIDDEARATFQEAICAHEAGLYRCVCRVLFPEIERMIGVKNGGSKAMLKQLTAERDLANFIGKGRFDYVLFSRLIQHIYERVDPDRQVTFANDHVPNRHAALHGLVRYSTHKHSMNMLILADYVFRILPSCNDS